MSPNVSGSLFVIGALSIFAGLLGLAPVARRAGGLGRTGVALLSIATAAFLVHGAIWGALGETARESSLRFAFEGAGHVLALAGIVILGVAARRTKALPNWAASMLMLLPLVFFAAYALTRATLHVDEAAPVEGLPLTLANVGLAALFGSPYLVLGYTLLRE